MFEWCLSVTRYLHLIMRDLFKLKLKLIHCTLQGLKMKNSYFKNCPNNTEDTVEKAGFQKNFFGRNQVKFVVTGTTALLFNRTLVLNAPVLCSILEHLYHRPTALVYNK